MAKQVAFKIGDASPSDSSIARWLVVVSMALNDLVLVNKRLVEGLDADAPSHENIYGVRLAGMHAWELLKFLESGKQSAEVAAVLEGLPDDAKRDYRKALACLGSDKPQRFKRSLARARDLFSHYVELDRKDLIRALKAVADHEGKIAIGDALADTRLLYADEVAAQLFFRAEGESTEELEDFLTALRELLSTLLDFTQRALDAHFRTLPQGTVRFE